jgi:hypothetical protein
MSSSANSRCGTWIPAALSLSQSRLIELLVAFAEGADVHAVDRDLGERQGAGKLHGLFDRVHAAHPRAVRNPEGFVARAGAPAGAPLK